MNYIRIFFIICFLLVSLPGCDYVGAEKHTLDIAREVVTLIEQDDLDAAFDLLKLHWPLSDAEVDNLKEHTVQQRKTVIDRYGKTIRVEFIKTDVVGDSLIRHTFIEKFERHALKWQLSFYRPDKKWIINSVYWDDKISELY